MTNLEKAARQALEALEYIEHNYMSLPAPAEKAITAIKEVLANVPASDTSQERVDETAKQRHEQEPEWYHGVDAHGCNRFYHKTEVRPSEFSTPLYTTPPQRKPLTDEIPKGVLLAIQRAGLTLVMTAQGYHLMNLGPIEVAHGIKE